MSRLKMTFLLGDNQTLGLWTGHLWTGLILGLLLAILVRFVIDIVYNLYFHPLAQFPGPKFAAFSNIPYSYWFLGGRQPYKILDLHLKYGPVVRTAPNELSFNSAQSWKDIYGFRQHRKTFIKSVFYDGGSFAARGVTSIVSERRVEEHAHMRRYLSHAFSDRSLSEQEGLIAKNVDKFVKVVGMAGAKPSGFNIGNLYGMLTFDITGDLAFGETFGGLDQAEPHPWISITLGALRQGALADVLKRFPAMGKALSFLMSSQLKRLTNDTKANEEMAIELVNRRIARETKRTDFMTRILEQRDPDEVSDLQLAAHASDFVLAGSETTATAIGAMTYYLLRTPAVMAKLQQEIWEAFRSYDEICDKSTLGLPYLRAVILEGLRIYPPLPLGLPRIVPKGGDTVDGHFLPERTIVSTNPVASSLDPASFKDPLTFRPERWIGRNDEDVLEATQPFSLGPRSCLGRNLAWMELRTILSKMIWMYDLELADKSLDWHRDSEMHTLWKKPKLMIRAKRRQTRA